MVFIISSGVREKREIVEQKKNLPSIIQMGESNKNH
jgi:hypothetical protein